MRLLSRTLLWIAVPLLAGCAATSNFNDSLDVEQGGRIQLTQVDGRFVLSVPASSLVMTLPAGSWAPGIKDLGGGTSNPRYFVFENKDGYILSGWFEPASVFPGNGKHWENINASLALLAKRGMPPPLDITYDKIGNWQTMMYDQQALAGKIQNSHLRANLVQSGTWIDIHISITSGSFADNRQRLKSVLKGVTVADKGKG